MRRRVSVLSIIVLLVFAMIPVVESKAAPKLSKSSASVTVGKTLALKVTGTKKSVRWWTTRSKVATVSSKGTVKGVSVGTAYIKAKAEGKTMKCKITVKAASKSPSAATKKYDAGEYSITKTHSGEGTFYDRTSGGASNLDYMEDNYYTCAMNNYDYMNGLAGAYIEITDKDGDKIKAVVTDRLPEGKKGDVDMTRKTFAKIEPLVTGRMKITWKIIPFPTKEPIRYVFKPTSTQYWAQVQVRNGRYPIKKLEYYNTTLKKYVELQREEYNYFTAPSGMGTGSIKFRVTDFYGHVLTDSGIKMNASSAPVKGKKNFPY